MGSPAYIFSWMTDAEFATVRAYGVESLTNGMITSLSGGAKSGSYSRIDPMQFAIEVKAEIARRARTVPANKIYQDFRTSQIDGF